MTEPKEKYARAINEREKHVEEIIKSPSKKKIVVAGPGTGKTYLFKQILRNKNNTLTLTFINDLVEDLSLELYGLSDVKTLHGFARSVLSNTAGDAKIFPKLSEVIKEDAKILLNKEIDFDYLFHNRDDNNENIKFYEKRKSYYDKYYGYSDIIFAIVKYFENKRDKIPSYEQIVVDEFQDFNKLEVSLIDLLSEKSPILLTGDDDQALYHFKSASADHIRQRHSGSHPGYASFNLPYCSRCTRVIVEAVNDVINAAIKNGYLKGRVNKPYQYFEDEQKDKQSEQNPKIIYGQFFDNQLPWFINTQMEEIAKEVKEKFSVLVISPTKIKSRSIVRCLRDKGFENIEAIAKKDEKGLSLLDGLKILLDEKTSNLGWRIVSRFILSVEGFKNLLKETNKDSSKNIADIVNPECKKEVTALLKVLRSVRDDKVVAEKELDEVLRKVGFHPYEISKDALSNEIVSTSQRSGHRGLIKIPIKATTIQSAKGLDAEYVFITHFDDQYFIKNGDKKKISDQDICNFLVALTRAKKRVFLISSNNKKYPTFLKWINKDRIEDMSMERK